MNTRFLSKSLTIALAISLLSACGKSKDEIRGAPAADPYFSAVAEQDQLGDPFHVHLKWGTGDTPLLWILDRFEKYTGRRESIAVDRAKREFIDREVKPGALYTYYLVAQGPYRYGPKTQVLVPYADEN